LRRIAIIDAPTNGAIQYNHNHKSPIDPERKTGARDLAGFIDAPHIDAKKKISKPTILPIAMPLNPLNAFVYTGSKITTTKKHEARTSHKINIIGKL
jgi:hypothetical protein